MRPALHILFASVLALAAPQGGAAVPAPVPAGEPTNATEIAAQRSVEDRRIDALYLLKKAALTPERRAWQEVLERHLGSFYLPLHKRDFVQGVSNAWDFVADDPALPRVLLIGDSISRGYTLPARAALARRANVHRAPENCGPSANALAKLDDWLGDGRWDVIHFNFGIHDRSTPPAEYEVRLKRIVERLQRTGAKLIWASSTPLPAKSSYGPDEAIVERNTIAARVMQRNGVRTDDLYAEVKPRLAEFQKPDDVHFSSAGYAFLGSQVAQAIERELPPR